MNNSAHKTSFGSVLLSIIVGAFLTALGTSTINTALPYLIEHFHTSLDMVKWTMTGFMLATGVMAPITCYLGEKYSYKRIYLTSLIGFTIASALCALSWNIHSLIVFRILQGVFNGLAAPATMTIIYQVLPKEKQASATSLWGLSAMLAPAFGPTLSGWLLQHFSWQMIFLVNIPLGILAIFMVIKFTPYYKLNPSQKLDLFGFIACMAASGLILTAFSEATQWGWTSYKTILLLLAGGIVLTSFILRELTTRNPVLNLKIFQNKGYTISIIVRSIITMSLYAGSLLTPLFLQNAQKLSALDAGLIMLPSSLMMAICMVIVGKLYERMDPRVLVVIGILLIAAGSFRLSYLSLDTGRMQVILYMVLRNVGIAFATGPVTNMGMSSLDRKIAGNGSAVNNWVNQSIGSLSIGIFTSLLTSRAAIHADALAKNHSLSNATVSLLQNQAFVLGINDIYFISSVIVLLALPLCLLLRKGSVERTIKPAKEGADHSVCSEKKTSCPQCHHACPDDAGL